MIEAIIRELEKDETGKLRKCLIDSLFPNGIRVSIDDTRKWLNEDPRIKVTVQIEHIYDYDYVTISS